MTATQAPIAPGPNAAAWLAGPNCNPNTTRAAIPHPWQNESGSASRHSSRVTWRNRITSSGANMSAAIPKRNASRSPGVRLDVTLNRVTAGYAEVIKTATIAHA
jgi:hypothetical protein